MESSLQMTEPGLGARVTWRWRALFGDPIPRQALGFCFDHLAVLLRAGFSLPDAFARATRVSDPELQHIGESLITPLSRGVSLSRALAPYRHRFPELVLPILEVGEVSGTMEGASLRLAEAFQKGAAVDRKFRYAVFDPWLVILLLTLYQAATHLVSSVAEMALGALQTLLLLSACYILGRLVLRGLFRWQWLRLQVDTLKLALPQMGTVARNLAAARWGRSFATLWNAGVPVSDALEVSSRSALNAFYERALLQAARQTRQGWTLHQSLSATQLLPSYLLGIIAVGETGGNLADSLERFVVILEDEAFTKAAQQFALITSGFKVVLTIAAALAVLH
jgi:type IV pilus assembly protein PilC